MSRARRPTETMRVEVIFAIRDARGLTAYEKSFLFVVESRGSAWSRRKVMVGDMGMSLSKFNNLATSLEQRGLITAKRRRRPDGADKPTEYRVVASAVQALVPDVTDTESDREDVPSEERLVGYGRGGRVLTVDDSDRAEDTEEEHQDDPEDDHQEEPEEDPDKEQLETEELKDFHLIPDSGREKFDRNGETSTSPRIVADRMDSEGLRAVAAVIDLQAGKIHQLREVFNENGDRLIIIRGLSPMTLEMIRRQIAHDSDLLAHVLQELPMEELDLALEIGAFEYEMRAREAALLERMLEEQNRSAM